MSIGYAINKKLPKLPTHNISETKICRNSSEIYALIKQLLHNYSNSNVNVILLTVLTFKILQQIMQIG
jgi:hypothetical protein